MKLIIILALALCVCAAEKTEESAADTTTDLGKDKRQTEEGASGHLIYRTPRRQQEQGAPVEEPQEGDKISASPNQVTYQERYRPGQVFSVNPQELLEIQPERKAPVASGTQLQQLYAAEPQPEHKQNLQYYILEPQLSRQIAIQPSHALIARPHSSSDGAEASVGAALSVSDTSSSGFEHELLTLLGRNAKQEEPRQTYAPVSQPAPQNPAPQYTQNSPQTTTTHYAQIDRYITKSSKKPTKQRSKTHNLPPQVSATPQQYLIETTNFQQQPQPTVQHQQYQAIQQTQAPQFKQQYQSDQQQQYQQQQQLLQQHAQLQQQQNQLKLQLQQYQRPAQTVRPLESLRYVPLPQAFYESPEPQGLKVVPAPKLQRPQITYRFIQQLPQTEQASPKQFRVLQQSQNRPEQPRLSVSDIERPVTYLKRNQDVDKMRSVKIIEQPALDSYIPQAPQASQVIGEKYFLRPIFRHEQRGRYEGGHVPAPAMEISRSIERTKQPISAIYVSKNLTPKKVLRPATVRIEQPQPEYSVKVEPSIRIEQSERPEQIARIEQQSRTVEEERSRLPPPKNNKAYTQEEFAALIAAGYSVTPIPVGSSEDPAIQAQSRLVVDTSGQSQRRPLYSRRHQYVPFKSDEAP